MPIPLRSVAHSLVCVFLKFPTDITPNTVFRSYLVGDVIRRNRLSRISSYMDLLLILHSYSNRGGTEWSKRLSRFEGPVVVTSWRSCISRKSVWGC